jgi:hypothetical protein
LPEEISIGVGGLDEAVGVEQKAITQFQPMDRVGGGGKVEGREDQTILDDFEHSSAPRLGSSDTAAIKPLMLYYTGDLMLFLY